MLKIYRITALLMSLLVVVFFVGCDDDDNPVDNDHGSEHLHAVGVKLVHEGADISVAETADSSDVVGLIEVDEGSEEHFQVWFLNDENEWYYPGDTPQDYSDHSLQIVIGNGDILEAGVEGWEMHLSGLHEGDSWIRVKVLHEDHADYISPHLRATVHHSEGSHGAPVGMYLKQNNEVVLTVDASNEITGNALITNGSSETYNVWFFDEHEVEFQPGDDHNLGIEIDNEQIVTSSVTGWNLQLNGLAAGSTTFTVTIMHGDHSHYTSPAVPVTVE